jgi:hypothetical protein
MENDLVWFVSRVNRDRAVRVDIKVLDRGEE